MKRQRRQINICILLLVSCLITIIPSFAISIDEYSIKAAFLVKFFDYVSWDELDAKNKQTITVVGEDPFGKILDSYVSKVKEKSKSELYVERKLSTSLGDDFDGHILFSVEQNPQKISVLIEKLKNKKVLLVGEGEQFAKLGGTIAFIIKNNKVRFVVNLRSAKKAGVNISSKLLRLAKIIR